MVMHMMLIKTLFYCGVKRSPQKSVKMCCDEEINLRQKFIQVYTTRVHLGSGGHQANTTICLGLYCLAFAEIV